MSADGEATGRPPAAPLPDGTRVGELPLRRPVVRDALLSGGIRTLGDLGAVPDRELLRLRHFSPRSLAEVRALVPPSEADGP